MRRGWGSHCSAHGLRKAAAVRHALNGATAPELMACFGWTTIGEAQRYIEEANRIRLAESAAEKVISRTGIGEPKSRFAKNGRKSLKRRKTKLRAAILAGLEPAISGEATKRGAGRLTGRLLRGQDLNLRAQ